MPSNLDSFQKLSAPEEIKLRNTDPDRYVEYLIFKYSTSRSKRERLFRETFEALPLPVFVFLLPEEERALRSEWPTVYSKYSVRKDEFRKNASAEDKKRADMDLVVRKKFLIDGMSKEDAVKAAFDEVSLAAAKEVEKSENLLHLAVSVEKRTPTEENSVRVENAQAALESAQQEVREIAVAASEARTEDFFPPPEAQELPQVIDNGAPCKYQFLDVAEDFLAQVSRNRGTQIALDAAGQAMANLEGRGDEGAYFSTQFLLFYLQNLADLYESHERFKSPSGAIEALAELMAWKKRDDRLKRYRQRAKEINSRCYPAQGYIDQIDSLLDNRIEFFRKRLIQIYDEQIRIASGEVGSHPAISLSGEAMSQFEELGLFEESAIFQLRQLEEFDKLFSEIADPSYSGLHLIDGSNGAKALLAHLKDLKERDDRLNRRFMNVPDKSEFFVEKVKEIKEKILQMQDKFTKLLDEIEKKVRSGYDGGGSDAVVMAEEEVSKEISQLEAQDIEEEEAKKLLDAEKESIALFNAERQEVHARAFEEERAIAEQVRLETIEKFHQNLEARKILELQESQAQRLLGQQKLDSIANIMIGIIDELFAAEVQKLSAPLPAQSQSLGFFDILSSAGNFIVSNADKIAALGTTAIVGFGTIEQIKLQEKIADLNEDIARKQLELQEKVTNAQLRLLDVQADSLEEGSAIQNEILQAQKEIALLQASRDKRILEATSEFEVLKAQIEATKQKIVLTEEEKELREIEFIQQVEEKAQQQRLDLLEKELENIEGADIIDFLNQAEIEKAQEAKEKFIESTGKESESKFPIIPVVAGIVGISALLLLLKGRNKNEKKA